MNAYVLWVVTVCTSSSSKIFRQGGNAWNLFDFDNQSAAFFCVDTIKYYSILSVPSKRFWGSLDTTWLYVFFHDANCYELCRSYSGVSHHTWYMASRGMAVQPYMLWSRGYRGTRASPKHNPSGCRAGQLQLLTSKYSQWNWETPLMGCMRESRAPDSSRRGSEAAGNDSRGVLVTSKLRPRSAKSSQNRKTISSHAREPSATVTSRIKKRL